MINRRERDKHDIRQIRDALARLYYMIDRLKTKIEEIEERLNKASVALS
jgi:hypothetical protein